MSRRASVSLFILLLAFSMFTPLAVHTIVDESVTRQEAVPSQEANTANILIDEAHCATNTELWTPGNASRFGSFMMSYGHHVDTNFDSSLDSGILDSYDIFMLFFPQVALTASEVSAVHDFVDNGGHLLLVGIDNRPTVSNYTSQPLNAVSQVYGITFNQDSALGSALRSQGNFIEHRLLYHADSALGRAGNFLQSCSLTVESPAYALATVNERVGAAAAEIGDSKIVAIGGAAPFLVLGHDSWLVNQDDHHQLILNMLDWMLGNPERDVVVPEENIITVGHGPDLNETEIEEYQMFTGIIHEHTDYSDGQSSAAEMTLAAMNKQADFMVMTDHSWENPGLTGIHGALACRSLVNRYGLDILIGVGAELSNGQHILGFPLTENIWSGDMQEKVDSVHDQGGIATLCHPLLGQGYIEPWTNYDTYGYDAFEVLNDRFSWGEGESAYFKSFFAASDTHFAGYVGRDFNVIFVKNPSGPNGTLSVMDIADAIVDRRLVAINQVFDITLGDEVWVNRYLEMRDAAEAEITDAGEAVDQAINDGAQVLVSNTFLNAANDALDWKNPSRAIELATSAVDLLALDLDIDTSDLDGAGPDTSVDIGINVQNGMTSDIQLNVTPFFYTSITFDSPSITIDVSSGSSGSYSLSGTTDSNGYTRILLNFEILTPSAIERNFVIPIGGIIANVSEEVSAVNGGYNATIQLLRDPIDSAYITSVSIEYDTGGGPTSATMEDLGGGYSITIGPYAAGTNVTYTISINDYLGNEYTIGERIFEINSTGGIVDVPTLIIVGGVAVGIIALVLVVVKFRR
ncbi:MAG: PHP domain-containing protein [Candidatus Thorarchaeota archaeon]